jgi:hypothetical protein
MPTENEIMQKFLIALALGTCLCSSVISPTLAADFYVFSINARSASIIDPTTIAAAQNGHRIFHLIDVEINNMWFDARDEMDCTAARGRRLSGAVHQGSTTEPSFASPEPWVTYNKGSVGMQMHDFVCHWTNSTPQKGSYLYNWTAPDFKTVVSQLSRVVMQRQKK